MQHPQGISLRYCLCLSVSTKEFYEYVLLIMFEKNLQKHTALLQLTLFLTFPVNHEAELRSFHYRLSQTYLNQSEGPSRDQKSVNFPLIELHIDEVIKLNLFLIFNRWE